MVFITSPNFFVLLFFLLLYTFYFLVLGLTTIRKVLWDPIRFYTQVYLERSRLGALEYRYFNRFLQLILNCTDERYYMVKAKAINETMPLNQYINTSISNSSTCNLSLSKLYMYICIRHKNANE